MIRKDELIEIGKIQKTHGLKGELNMFLEYDPEFLEEGNPLILQMEGIFVPFYITSIRTKGNTTFLVLISGVSDEKDASKYVNHSVYAIKSQLASFFNISEDEMLPEDDLINFNVIDEETGIEIGHVTEIDYSTENVLLIIRDNIGENIYIPFNEELINNIDVKNKTIRMNLPEGLISLNKKE